jgi:4-amino-4-deoxy-L-arabinose transferase-like glycosyltransferase
MNESNAATNEDQPGSVTPAAKLALWVVLVVYLVTSIAYNLAVPVGEAPDEPDHIGYVEILMRTGELPTIPRGSSRYSYEAEQPPLYYFFQFAWMRLIWPNDDLKPNLRVNPSFSFASDAVPNAYLHDYPPAQAVPVHLMRLLSTLFGLLALVFVWLAARTAWPEDAGGAVVAVGLAAFVPGFTFAAGTVSNDSLAAAFGAAITLALVYFLRRGVNMRAAILAGLAMGLGILSKRSLLVMLPLVALVPLVSPSVSRRTKWVGIGVILLLSVALGVWPFISNIVEHGDPFATDVTMQAKSEISFPLEKVPGFWLSPAYMMTLFNSFWGSFGLRNIDLPTWFYTIYYVLCGVALVGLARRLGSMSTTERWIGLMLVVVLLLVNAGVAYQNTQFWAVQGRLLLPGMAALTLLVGRGLSIIGGSILPFSTRARQIALAVLLLGLALLNWYALVRYILVPYYT